MPTEQQTLSTSIAFNKTVARNVLGKLFSLELGNAEIADFVNAVVEASALTAELRHLNWGQDSPNSAPVESSPIVDISGLGFAIDIDETIALKICGANVYPDGDCSVDISAEDAEICSISLRALTTAVNELNRLSKTYYPPEPPEEDESTLATPAQIEA